MPIRVDNFLYTLNTLAFGCKYFILDDFHKVGYRSYVIDELEKQNLSFVELQKTKDKFGRYSVLVDNSLKNYNSF